MFKSPLSGAIRSETGTSSDYRFYVVTNAALRAGLALHAGCFILFLALGISILAWVNAAGVVLFLICLRLNRKDDRSILHLVAALDVILNSTIGSIVVGWASGVHYFILCLVPLVFFFPIGRLSTKISVAAVLCASYIGLYAWTISNPPQVTMAVEQLQLLNIINIATTFLLFSFLSYHFIDSAHQVEQELKLVNRKLQRLATTDSLTNMFNRRTMIEYIEAEIKHYEHVGVPFALILCDIDDFKSFNDQYGHECGDFVLVTASELMMELLRAQDRLARWGGEEFLILLPLTTTEGAVSVAARIREELLNRAFQFYGQQLKITMTYGVTLYLPGNSVRECINRADRALLQGKERGKNRIILEDGSQNLVELQLDPVLD